LPHIRFDGLKSISTRRCLVLRDCLFLSKMWFLVFLLSAFAQVVSAKALPGAYLAEQYCLRQPSDHLPNVSDMPQGSCAYVVTLSKTVTMRRNATSSVGTASAATVVSVPPDSDLPVAQAPAAATPHASAKSMERRQLSPPGSGGSKCGLIMNHSHTQYINVGETKTVTENGPTTTMWLAAAPTSPTLTTYYPY